MKTQNDFKDDVAIKYGFEDWKQLLVITPIDLIDRYHDEAAENYKSQNNED